MKAMIFEGPGRPLVLREIETPRPGPGQILIRVLACAVCRTDLHILDGELPRPKLPLALGHEIVGRVEALGEGVAAPALGTRVGVPWLGWTCGECRFCRSGRENLCEKARFTGYDVDGGYAQYACADARYVFPLPDLYSDAEAAPLLCAGLIGYRTLRLAFEGEERLEGRGRRLGLYGFGAAAHLVAQAARHVGFKVYAFTSPGDLAAQDFARSCGAVFAGGSDQPSPEKLDAALIFAPVGALVPTALKALERGGCVCCGGIHMSDVPGFPYADLWEERIIRSVANLTRRDAQEFLALAPRIPARATTVPYPLERASEALEDLRHGRLSGAAVLIPPV
ncbi:zinc-dependent alcohol dehydrogenase family protein [Methylocella sp.]|uniref:zinc-dependent alcohol dehydrogenase family protein n=1 Tax=Methylocella sp. TaxID=1978226 RepID=UPI0035B179B2